MARLAAISYEAALEAALGTYRDHLWSEEHRKEVRDNPEYGFAAYRAAEDEAAKYLLAADTACDMISIVYDVSASKVLADLDALVARDNELVYV